MKDLILRRNNSLGISANYFNYPVFYPSLRGTKVNRVMIETINQSSLPFLG